MVHFNTIRGAKIVKQKISEGMSKFDVATEYALYPNMSANDLLEQYREFVTDEAIFNFLDSVSDVSLQELLTALGYE